MNDKYLLIEVYDREISILLYDSHDEARNDMKAALIEAMGGEDETIFNEYTKEEEYDWEPDSAWLNHRHSNGDWLIISFTEAQLRSKQAKAMKFVNSTY